MINIKIIKVPKKNSKSTSSKTSGYSGTTSTSNNTQNIINTISDWFFYDNDNNAICCRYDFYSNGTISANGPAIN